MRIPHYLKSHYYNTIICYTDSATTKLIVSDFVYKPLWIALIFGGLEKKPCLASTIRFSFQKDRISDILYLIRGIGVWDKNHTI